VSPLAEPPGELETFPAFTLREHTRLFRVHRREHGPWWFCSDGLHRFDLESPRGTCHLATRPIGAFLEVFRDTAVVHEDDVSERRLSAVFVRRQLLLADASRRLARGFGVTAGLHSSRDYALTQRWAAALAKAGFQGVRYLLSHDPSQGLIGIALFGTRGSPAPRSGWRIASTAPLSADLLNRAFERFGIRVLPSI
jgi:hypothetical protein